MYRHIDTRRYTYNATSLPSHCHVIHYQPCHHIVAMFLLSIANSMMIFKKPLLRKFVGLLIKFKYYTSPRYCIIFVLETPDYSSFMLCHLLKSNNMLEDLKKHDMLMNTKLRTSSTDFDTRTTRRDIASFVSNGQFPGEGAIKFTRQCSNGTHKRRLPESNDSLSVHSTGNNETRCATTRIRRRMLELEISISTTNVCEKPRKVLNVLLEDLAKSLSLDKKSFVQYFEPQQSEIKVRVNYYPPSPRAKQIRSFGFTTLNNNLIRAPGYWTSMFILPGLNKPKFGSAPAHKCYKASGNTIGCIVWNDMARVFDMEAYEAIGFVSSFIIKTRNCFTSWDVSVFYFVSISLHVDEEPKKNYIFFCKMAWFMDDVVQNPQLTHHYNSPQSVYPHCLSGLKKYNWIKRINVALQVLMIKDLLKPLDLFWAYQPATEATWYYNLIRHCTYVGFLLAMSDKSTLTHSSYMQSEIPTAAGIIQLPNISEE
ncbi:Isopenicillin N synthase [Artemisia annua]|uniref:Isopenicillin N synthase n=1 Tax=Artemisia annua TaxID=35608 RepID=A0A2U1QEL8_ARTAN|nr:Isopenicillin N synthase [Artemisia annua]